MYRSVLNADFVLAIFEVVKVSNSVLHPVLVITLGEILTCMRSSALLQHRQIKSAWTHCTHTHTHTLPLSCLHTHARTHTARTRLKTGSTEACKPWVLPFEQQCKEPMHMEQHAAHNVYEPSLQQREVGVCGLRHLTTSCSII